MKLTRCSLPLALSALCLGALPAASAHAGERLRYALLPLRPTAETTPAYARTVTLKVRQQLRAQGAEVLPLPAVERAMQRSGGPKRWTTETLVALGRTLKVDRVLYGSLRLQAMVRMAGDVVELEVEQVDVASGQAHGSFKRITAFGRAHGLALLPSFARRIVRYDGKTPPLVMKEPAPMKAPDDAPKEKGMAFVPAGEFIMGSDRAEIDEEPRHIVYTDAFFIDVHEVTNGQYDRCVARRKCQRSTARNNPKMRALDHPVAGVGHADALAYCRFAGKRLLTEAEWEKAARGSDERVFPWGNDWHADYANMANAKDGFTHTAPVGSFPKGASPYGVQDLAGNVWEWTADAYDPNYYFKSPARNPQGPPDGGNARIRRVMRGGSWMYDVPAFLTTHNRSPGRPWIRKMWVGIRCGKDAPGQKSAE